MRMTLPAPLPPAPCRHCGSPGVRRCGRCKEARYCSAACQRSDWPSHKATCGSAAPPTEQEDSAAAPPTVQEDCAAAPPTVQEDCAAAPPSVQKDCAFCLSPVEDALPLECAHTLCRACVAAYDGALDGERPGSDSNSNCPLCRAPLPPGAAQLVDDARRSIGRFDRSQRAGDDDAAAAALGSIAQSTREAIALDPRYGRARRLLAWALSCADDDDGAEREWCAALDAAPDDARARVGLGDDPPRAARRRLTVTSFLRSGRHPFVMHRVIATANLPRTALRHQRRLLLRGEDTIPDVPRHLCRQLAAARARRP